MSIFELFLLSAVPFTEQRATIPLGILLYGYEPVLITLVCFIGTLLPAPFILIFFNKIYEIIKKIHFFDHVTSFIDKKIRKNTKHFETYKELALIFFIGIPLPGTGVWTGSVIAAFLGLDLKKSMICIIAGNLLSALSLLFLCLLFPAVLGTVG